MSTKLNASDFVHLHNHTEYSVLDGLTKVSELVGLVKDYGMSAIAITDHGTLSGAVDFYEKATSSDLKPVIGIETYVASRKHTDKDPAKDKNRFHLILLAMNNVGYKNLMKLSSIANLDGFYYFPRVDHELLEKYKEGIICLSACMSGEVGSALQAGQYDQAKDIAKWYKGIFKDRYYLEIQDHGHPNNPYHSSSQETINKQVLRLGQELDIPVVVTCDAHYLKHEDQEAHEVLLCVGTASYLSEKTRMSLKDFPLFVTNPKDIIKRWGDTNPEVILNTKKIADRCQVNITFDELLIPKFDVPDNKNESDYLLEEVYSGLAHRYLTDKSVDVSKLTIAQIKKQLPKEVLSRAEYELKVIIQMGFAGYFLIISDFVNWGKSQGIIFGPGRGSAAGSIISYALRITEIDPLVYDLLFERFLNPDRISMPDIDIDIQDTRREEVISYCVQKYGKERVANIVTFGRMFARNAVRDVARVLEVPYSEADRLAKMLPMPIQGAHVPLKDTLVNDQGLRREYQNSESSKRVLDLAVKLEGTIRSHGIHAAGIVIAPDDIVNFAPLEMAQKGVVSTQYSQVPIEELGLLKMDLLGLSNLTIVKNCLRIVKKVYKKDIDINSLKLNDPKTFELFQKGDTTGVFQFESAGMKRYLKELGPTNFEDIIAMGALYRPGPMQWIEDFIARKRGRKAIEYFHDSMEPALVNTYGVIIYQEQVMQISREMCGFTGGQADRLRKAVAKKKPEELAKMKADFIDGALKTVKTNKKAMEKFWGQLEAFAAYCFPKAHAACYAVIAYQTAYLKANYPDSFMSALMTSDYDNIDRLAIEIAECRRMGIEVFLPDINESFEEFAVVPGQNKIRFGLLAVKNVGSSAVKEILEARNEARFKSLEDFFNRVDTSIVNRKSLESLIKSGAFDSFGDRNLLLTNLDVYLAYSSRIQKDRLAGQTDLFNSANSQTYNTQTNLKVLDAKDVEPVDKKEALKWERELLGLYISEHPLKSIESYLTQNTAKIDELTVESHGSTVIVGGTISYVKSITTKNGQKMSFIKVEDMSSEIEVVIFPGLFQDKNELIERDNLVIVKGRLSGRDRSGTETGLKIIADDISRIDVNDDAVKISADFGEISKKLFIRLESSDDQSLLLSLKQAIDQHQGSTDVVLVLGPANDKRIIKLPVKTKINDDLLGELNTLVGNDNVKVH